MSGMTMAFRAARPTVATGSTTGNSLPLQIPEVTRSRAVAGRPALLAAVASRPGPAAHPRAAAAAARTSGEGPPGDVGSSRCATEPRFGWQGVRRRIRFTVSLTALVGLRGNEAVFRPVPAASGIVPGIMEQHLAPGLLRLLLLSVPFEARGDEEEPFAFSQKIALAFRGQARNVAGKGFHAGEALQLFARAAECHPGVVEVARSNPPFGQLPSSALVRGAGGAEIPRGHRRGARPRFARPRIARLRRLALPRFDCAGDGDSGEQHGQRDQPGAPRPGDRLPPAMPIPPFHPGTKFERDRPDHDAISLAQSRTCDDGGAV